MRMINIYVYNPILIKLFSLEMRHPRCVVE